ncbi:MAG: hypothetical protein L0229_22830 [Blastocatellia bacterium]|nr:hypothetical protein [Blastocatellia bacterium]
MIKKAFISSVILIGVLMLGGRTIALQQEPRAFEGLIAASEAVVAVEILSTDYTATPSDGPMVAVAKVLKGLKGPLTAGGQFRFSETAWVGPTYKKGEYRILFLEKTGPQEFPKTTEWRILSHLYARTDFFIEKDALSDLSLESLESFLKKIQERKDRPKKVVFGKGTIK